MYGLLDKIFFCMTTRSLLTIIGFILMTIGVLGIVLSLVGVKLAYLMWLENIGSLVAFVSKLTMIIVGAVLMVAARSDFSGEKEV